jgi:hypothetical protein
MKKTEGCLLHGGGDSFLFPPKSFFLSMPFVRVPEKQQTTAHSTQHTAHQTVVTSTKLKARPQQTHKYNIFNSQSWETPHIHLV